MKGNKKILVIAVLLLLITVSYGTYAIYKTTLTGAGEVTAAAWNIQFKDGNNVLTDTFTVTFGQSDCVNNSHVADGVIAPGATCTKDITLVATGTQVDVDYTVTADNNAITATKNSTSVTTTGANTFTATLTDTSGDTLDGEILMTDSPMSETLRVTLTWAGTESDTVDPKDTDLNGATITVPLTLTAKQMIGS